MKRILFCILPLCLSAPLLAQAAEGYVVADISLQAGPDTEYPAISELAAGTPVQIEGCIEGYSWCDVIAEGERGWVAGSFIQEDYDNQRVIVEDYGPRIGIPIVAFALGAYWDQHYHNRSWYGQRTQWEGRHIQSRQRARPSEEVIRNASRFGGNRSAPNARSAPAQQAQQAPAVQPRAAREMQHPQTQPTPTPQQASSRQAEPRANRATEQVAQHRMAPRTNPASQQAQQQHATPRTNPAPQPAQQRVAAHTNPAATPRAEPRAKQESKPANKDNGHKDDPKDH